MIEIGQTVYKHALDSINLLMTPSRSRANHPGRNSSLGYIFQRHALDKWTDHCVPMQESVAEVGAISPPLTGPTPATVPGEEYISEPTSGPNADATATNRGLAPLPTTYTVQGVNSTRH